MTCLPSGAHSREPCSQKVLRGGTAAPNFTGTRFLLLLLLLFSFPVLAPVSIRSVLTNSASIIAPSFQLFSFFPRQQHQNEALDPPVRRAVSFQTLLQLQRRRKSSQA